ncbi:hypothetical protein Tco_1091849 [Tanacetum coccineum]|uniref:Uncharacterized protein n=1 Tax=Tanacetum coccineum TaxID=301880 RepID=A0ABQ5I851_9ASTR
MKDIDWNKLVIIDEVMDYVVSEVAVLGVPVVAKEVIVISSNEEISSDEDIHFSYRYEDIPFSDNDSDDKDLESDNDSDSFIYEKLKAA